MVSIAQSPGTQELAELNALHDAMTEALAAAGASSRELAALKSTEESRKRRLADLSSQVAQATSESKRRCLGDMSAARIRQSPLRRRSRRASLGDLASGATAFEQGQEAKINDWANQGYYSTMLEAAMRLAVAPGVEPEAALADLGMFDALAAEVTKAVIVPAVRIRSLAALASMRAAVLGQPSELALDREEYDRAVQGDLRYISTHQPNSGFFERAIRQTAGVVQTLDKYVPGWTVLLDIASPVLPIAPLVSALVGAVPLVGRAGTLLLDATPLFGKGGGLIPNSPLSYAVSSGAGTVGMPQLQFLDAPLQVITGPAGAVKFQVTKSAAQSAAQGSGVLDALEALGSDLLDGYALAIQLVTFFVTGPEVLAFSSAIQALKAAISLKKTIDAANALRAATDRARQAAIVKAQADDAELASLEAALASLRRKLGLLVASAGQALVPVGSGLGKLAAGLLLAWGVSEALR